RCNGQCTFANNFCLTFCGVKHGHDHTSCAGYEIHGSSHTRHELVGNHPIGQSSLLINLQAPKHGDIKMSSSNEAKGHRTVKGTSTWQSRDGLSTRIREGRMAHTLLRNRPSSDQSVFRLEENMNFGRNVTCHQCWNSDTKIDEHACSNLAGD